jgi:hypothetical protein
VAEHALLTSQWDDAFTAITASGLDPREFRRDERRSLINPVAVPAIVHEPTGSYFVFDWEPSYPSSGHLAVFSPGLQTYEETALQGDWYRQMDVVRQWLQNVRREYTAPDLWAELERERELLAGEGSPVMENTPFTPEEQEHIARQMRELGEYVRQNYDLAAEQAAALESRLDYLVDAAKRTSRLDWRTLLVGTMFQLAVEAIVPPEAVRHGLVWALRGLGALFGVEPPDFPELPSPG